jgi:hypothetical protein
MQVQNLETRDVANPRNNINQDEPVTLRRAREAAAHIELCKERCCFAFSSVRNLLHKKLEHELLARVTYLCACACRFWFHAVFRDCLLQRKTLQHCTWCTQNCRAKSCASVYIMCAHCYSYKLQLQFEKSPTYAYTPCTCFAKPCSQPLRSTTACASSSCQ